MHVCAAVTCVEARVVARYGDVEQHLCDIDVVLHSLASVDEQRNIERTHSAAVLRVLTATRLRARWLVSNSGTDKWQENRSGQSKATLYCNVVLKERDVHVSTADSHMQRQHACVCEGEDQ